jgi:hypothetical protein
LARETEVLEEEKKLPQCRFVHHKFPHACSDANPGRCGRKPATNGLSHGTAARRRIGRHAMQKLQMSDEMSRSAREKSVERSTYMDLRGCGLSGCRRKYP